MAYSFTAASSQHLTTPDTASLDITGALTLVAWVKSTGSYGPAVRGILTKYQTVTNQRSYALTTNSSGQVFFIVSRNGSTETDSVIGSTAVGTNWRHIAGVYTPSTKLEAFLDGASNGSKTSSIFASLHSGTAPLAVGMVSFSAVNNCWDGLIAEAAVYNAALTAAEVASLAKGMTCDKVRPQSLVFYAPLVRDLIDQKGGLTITNNNAATVAAHTRVYA
jgi:hypothetical protein